MAARYIEYAVNNRQQWIDIVRHQQHRHLTRPADSLDQRDNLLLARNIQVR